MKVILRNNTATNCGTGYKLRGDIDAELDGNQAIDCRKAYDISDKTETDRESVPKEQGNWHETPAGIVSLNVAALLSGTAIGRVIGL